MTMQSIQAFIARHSPSAAGLAALAASLDARASGQSLDPAVAASVHALFVAIGATDVLDDVLPEEAAAMLSLIRLHFAAEHKLLRAETRAVAWDYTSPELLQGVGGLARGHAQEFTRAIVPALEGLSDRLRSRDAALLDVGVGVAGSAIAIAQMWPEVHIVGIDPWQPSLALARRNVDEANLGDRITLREQGGETLDDESAYDFAWIANVFIPRRAIAPTCERVHRALRPGGWAMLATHNPEMDPVTAATVRLVLKMCGDSDHSTAELESLFRETGYTEVRTLPAVPGSVIQVVVGRRAP